MSIIEKLKASKKNKANNSAMENIAIKVSGYEGDFFCGVKLGTGEEIKLKLREFNGVSNFTRPSIDSFRDQGSSLHTKIGGVLQFDNCKLESEGSYSSSWANVLSSEVGKAWVFTGHTRLSSGTNSHGKQWLKVDLIKSRDYVSVDSKETLDKLLLIGLKPATQYSNPFTMIRVTDELGDSIMAYANVSKYQEKDKYNETMTANDSLEEFKNSEIYLLILEALKDSDSKVEILHAASIFAGPATLNKHFTNEREKARLESHYIIKDTDDEGNEKEFFGYADSIVAMRKHGDGTPYITHVKPINSNAKGIETKNINFIQSIN